MEPTQNHPLASYEENRLREPQIAAILASPISRRKKIRKLQELKTSLDEPLSRSHVSYYLNELKSEQCSFYGKLLAAPFLLAYLLFTLYRMYSYAWPEKAPFQIHLGLPEDYFVLLVYAAPIMILAYYVLRYLVSRCAVHRNRIRRPKTESSYPAPHVPAKGQRILALTLAFLLGRFSSAIPDLISGNSKSENTAFLKFEGHWWDSENTRCSLTIDYLYSTLFRIQIDWYTDETETLEWQFTSIYDEDLDALTYTGDKIRITYNEDGFLDGKEFVYTDGEGLILMDVNGRPYWVDYKENKGRNCIFEQEAASPF